MTVKEVMSEIETLRNLKHEAILDLKEYFVASKENHVYVITEIFTAAPSSTPFSR